MKALASPYLLHFEELIENDNKLFVILEYMEGGDLT